MKFHSSRAIAHNIDSEEDLMVLLETENNTMSKRVFQKIVKQKKEEKRGRNSLYVAKAVKKKKSIIPILVDQTLLLCDDS